MSVLSEILEKLSKDLDIAPSRYESAERSYSSIGEWLKRPASALVNFNVRVYLQGSFRLGIAIKPVDGEEHHDLDMVCEVQLDKASLTQEQLQTLVGSELIAYAKAFNMEVPERWDRCWTLNYADEARFHVDFLPSVPDGEEQIRILNELRLGQNAFAQTSIAITDRNHQNFQRKSRDWPVSNPNGYANWFVERMSRRMVLNERDIIKGQVDVAKIPIYRRHTPLQAAVRILKRHRDMLYIEKPSEKPSSVVITTLAAEAYNGETDVQSAITGILSRMHLFVHRDQDGKYRIDNPSDRRENFADSWYSDPKCADRFFDWLETATNDFQIASEANESSEIVEALAPRLGRRIVESAAPLKKGGLLATLANVASIPLQIMDAPHRRPLKWPFRRANLVNITRVTMSAGGEQQRIQSDDLVARESSLTFEATTNAIRPFNVFWQVVNTGNAAVNAGDLRGGFDVGEISPGTLIRKETARYPGTHSIQCFIVKDRVCIARSPVFLVRIGN